MITPDGGAVAFKRPMEIFYDLLIMMAIADEDARHEKSPKGVAE